MKRYEIIKRLIEKYSYKSYLEIGVLGNETYNSFALDVKHSVDPNGQAVFTMTSDEFFANHCKQGYDLIFIDGLHLKEQVQKDIENSLTHLNKGGTIVVHDCLPAHEWEQFREGLSGKPWTGDVWKEVAHLIHYRDNKDLTIRVVDTDCGCGIIHKREEQWEARGDYTRLPELTWEYFVANRNRLMNVITVEEFLGRYQ